MKLEEYTDNELREELVRRAAKICKCGIRRREIIENDQGWYPRAGCLTCNTWDSKKQLNGAPLR